MELLVGKAYYLEDMVRPMWDRPHPRFGAPPALATRYLGSLRGNRRQARTGSTGEGREEGVLFMHDADLERIKITPVE